MLRPSPSRDRPRRAGALALLALLLLAAAPPAGPDAAAHGAVPPRGRPVFTNVTAAAGLGDFLHAGYLGKRGGDPEPGPYFPEIIGSGGCWLDADGDGWLDAYLVNSLFMRHPEKNADRDVRSRLYRNLGDGTFQDRTDGSGAGLVGHHMGCAAADYDDDGDQDLYVTAWGGNTLLRNDGGFAFTNVTAAAGVRDEDCGSFKCWSTSASWLDHDEDGCLDLFVNHFGDWSYETHRGNGPEHAPGQKNMLFRSRCDGTFEDRTDAAGLGRERSNSWSSVAADYDRDGWPDLYVSNDGDENDLYLNNGDGTFRRKSPSAANDPRHGMGTAVGDLDGDDRWDIVTTNYVGEQNGVFRATDTDYVDLGSDPPFTDALDWSGWAAHWFDLGNDGDQDLMVVNGMTEDIGAIPVDEPMLLYENAGGARFERAIDDVGPALQEHLSARGGAWGDYDNDGDVDVLVTEAGENPAHLYRNDRSGGTFLALDLVGTAPRVARDAVGAHVTVEAPGLAPQHLEKVAGSGFLGSNDPRLHVGLGAAESADVEVRWPDGSVQRFEGVRANSFLRLTQGAAAPQALRELPFVRVAGPAQAAYREPLSFAAEAQGARGAAIAGIAWDFHDGATAEGATAGHAFADVGVFVVTATATDALGRAKTQAHAVRVTDALTATVEPDAAAFAPTERPRGNVTVRFSDGVPVRGAEVAIAVRTSSGSALVDSLAALLPKAARDLLGYAAFDLACTTGDDGRCAFEVPWTFEALGRGGPLSLSHPGLQRATATGGARGSVFPPAQAAWHVGVAPPVPLP